jgi:hypothetical protein
MYCHGVGYVNTAVFPKVGQMRFACAGQVSRSITVAIFWAADGRNPLFLDLEGYLRDLALRVTWPSFGNTAVIYNMIWYKKLICTQQEHQRCGPAKVFCSLGLTLS